MDKDSIILKYEQVEMQAISSGISDLAESNRTVSYTHLTLPTIA